MKPYYIEATIYFTDEIDGEEPFDNSEAYSFIFDAKTEKSARKKAEQKAMQEFKDEYGDEDVSNIRFEIDKIHETSGDARL